jgi:hypothetical protein
LEPSSTGGGHGAASMTEEEATYFAVVLLGRDDPTAAQFPNQIDSSTHTGMNGRSSRLDDD